MRRTILHTLTAVCVAALTACAADTTTDTTTPTATSSTASASTTVSNELVCTTVQTLSLTSNAKVLEAMTAAIAAVTDPAKEQAAVKALGEAMAPLHQGLNIEAARTADPELKAAITAYAAEAAKAKAAIDTAGADLDKAMDAVDQDALSAAEEKVINLCS